MPTVGRAASPTHFRSAPHPVPCSPIPRPLLPRWLQLKGFVLFPFSQNKPLLRSSFCSVSAGCGPACFYGRPGVIPVGLYVPAGWRGHGLVFLVLAWVTSAVFMGTGTSFLGSPFSLSIEWRGGWFGNLGADKPVVEQRLSCFLRDLV